MTKNNDIVAALATSRTVEHYTEVLGPDVPLAVREDIAQDTYLELLENASLCDIHRRGKLNDYVFMTIKKKIAKHYDKAKTLSYDDARTGVSPEELSGGWDG